MKSPIVIAAFGTTSTAMSTYNHIDRCLRNHFSEEEIIWAYSSKVITRELQKQGNGTAVHPAELLGKLADEGVKSAVIQSLHLFPGTEFHNLYRLARESPLNCTTGMPILTKPEDYDEIGEILRPVITEKPGKAILVLGHGTDHPVWTAYYSLEKLLRQKFGKRIYVGVVEKYPNSDHIVDEIATAGYTKVCIIPFFLVAGMHYRRDIISDKATSWKSKLESKKIDVEAIDYGLGLFPGLDQIITRHINEARTLLTSK